MKVKREEVMKKILSLQAGFVLIFISIFLFTVTFVTAEGDNPQAGQKLFESKCAQCHGKDAKGAAKMVKMLKATPAALDLTSDAAVALSAEDMEKVVSSGKKKMPKYKGKLTPEQIQQVVQYVKSLKAEK